MASVKPFVIAKRDTFSARVWLYWRHWAIGFEFEPYARGTAWNDGLNRFYAFAGPAVFNLTWRAKEPAE